MVMKAAALRVHSWKGLLKEEVSTRDITSREHARRLGPFCDLEGQRQVLWRRPSFDAATGLKRRSHFAYYPTKRRLKELGEVRIELEKELQSEFQAKGESTAHKKAVAEIVESLKRSIANRRPLNWAYRDVNLICSFKGDLLAGAVDVVPNYRVKTPLGDTFVVDVAVLGEAINKSALVLGAVEVELTHEFNCAKCLYLKSLAFPLFSIDISDATEGELNEAWADRILSETTANSSDERRRNFVYLNDIIAPVFLQGGEYDSRGDVHQFLVFASDQDLERLVRWLHMAAAMLKVTGKFQFHANRINDKNAKTKKSISNAGDITGEGWREMNEHSYLLVQLGIPKHPRGPLYYLHLLFARLVSSEITALVGYRAGGLYEAKDGIWCATKRQKYVPGVPWSLPEWVPFLPQQVGYPVEWVVRALAGLSK